MNVLGDREQLLVSFNVILEVDNWREPMFEIEGSEEVNNGHLIKTLPWNWFSYRSVQVTFYQSWEVIAKVQTKSSEVVVEVAG